MRVEIVSTTEARSELVNLLLARTPAVRADDAARMADVYLADVERILVVYDGKPPHSMTIRGGDGRLCWWKYVDGVWVVYVIDDERRAVARRGRTVTIRGFEPR